MRLPTARRFGMILILTAAAFAAGIYKPVHTYDPARDGAKDLADAVAEANRAGKRVLVVVGGQWCSWCHTLDRYFAQNPVLTELREKHYVVVKINWSPENKNVAVLSKYPRIEGYPHIFVLADDGKLLHSQDTGELEEGKSYNLDRMTGFLKKWAPEVIAGPQRK